MASSSSGTAGGEPRPEGVLRRAWSDRERRKTLVLGTLMIVAVIAAMAFAWSAYDATAVRQARLWSAQAIVLLGLRNGLSSADVATDHLLATGYVGFADDAVTALRANSVLLLQLYGAPEAVAAEALSLNATTAGCVALGYQQMEQVVATDPSQVNNTGFRQYVVNMGNGLGAVADLLSVRPDGTDPLGQIGPSNAAVIRQDMVMLSTLYAPGC